MPSFSVEDGYRGCGHSPAMKGQHIQRIVIIQRNVPSEFHVITYLHKTPQALSTDFYLLLLEHMGSMVGRGDLCS
jgi:hypothetical protein